MDNVTAFPQAMLLGVLTNDSFFETETKKEGWEERNEGGMK